MQRILKSTIFQFILVFGIVAIAFYFYTQLFSLKYFYGEDSFYHVAITKYMMEHGLIIRQFPYLNFTILKDNFVDWHFGFHLLLIPFIKIFGEINGPKILEMLLVAGVFGLIFLIFKEKKLKLSFLYTIFLFFLMPTPFYLRMAFIRAPILSLFVTLLALLFFIKNRPIALALTIFIYCWVYSLGSFLILIPIISFIIIQILRQEKVEYKIFVWALIGYFAGIIVNPYFPHNISSLIVQLEAASQNNRWYAGLEWRSPSAWDWFYNTLATTLLFLGGLVITIIKNIKQDTKKVAILIFSICILVLQWKSQRFYEYWPVFGGLIGFLLAGPYLETFLQNFRSNLKKLETWVVVLIILIFVQVSLFHGIWSYLELKKHMQNQLNNPFASYLEDIGNYLNNNSAQGDVVFTRWDYFPYLFYFDQKNYYIGGLDPIFTEKYNNFLFQKYIALTLASKIEDIDLRTIKYDFNANWVLVNESNQDFKDKLKNNSQLFQQMYEKNGFTVYKVN